MIQKKTGGQPKRRPQNYRNTRTHQVKKDDTLKIIPLGGMEEVGRNMTVF